MSTLSCPECTRTILRPVRDGDGASTVRSVQIFVKGDSIFIRCPHQGCSAVVPVPTWSVTPPAAPAEPPKRRRIVIRKERSLTP